MKKYILKNLGLLFAALFFGTLFSIGSTMVALILKDIIDVAISGNLDRFYTILIQTSFYLLILAVSFGFYSVMSRKLICKVTRMLRQDIFSGIFRRNSADFTSVNSADYLSALTNDVKNIEENYFNPILLCLQNILVFLASLGIMLYLSPLVLLCLFVATLLLVIIPGLFQGAIQKKQDAFSGKQSALTIAVKDFLSGFEVIRSYHMKRHTMEAFDTENNTVFSAKYALDKIVSIVEAVSTLLGITVQCSVLFLSAYLIITGKITAGALVGLVQVSGTIVVPIQALSQNIPKIQGCKPIINRLRAMSDYKDTSFQGTALPSFSSSLSVRNLHFGYQEDQSVLQGIDFTFEKGKKYAIVGKSGCGKTTLIHLLTGNNAAYQGEIFYDRAELKTVDIEKLNGLSSVIHQNVYMFDASIKDNICLYENVDESRLDVALTMSGVRMFLGEDKDLNSPAGENGNRLSGGQRQRVAVARALVKEKPILILDEGTSAIDMQTAYDIESKLLQLKDLTVITITHSLNPELLKEYDQILYMEEGRILEAGSYRNLMAQKGSFYQFSA